MLEENTSYVVCKRSLKKFYGPISNILTLTHEDFDRIDGYLNTEDQALILKVTHKFKNLMRNHLKTKSFGVDNIIFQNYCLMQLQRRKHEVCIAFFLDCEMKLIVDEIVAVGTYNQLSLTPKDILKRAIRHKAKNLIIVHNHPRGSLSPSNNDIDFTYTLRNCCESLSMNLIASLIVGGEYLMDTFFHKTKGKKTP